MINEHKKGVKAMKHTTKAKGVEPPKPRNFVAKNAINTGAGAHKDKKKAVKQGDVKHKHKEIAETSEHKLSLMLEMASVQSQINELKQSTKDSYKKKATDQVKELEPHAKDGEYKDIAKRAIDRRKKGLARVAEGSLEELANTSLKVKEPKDFVNTNDRKQVTYKVMKFKSGKDTYLINFTVKGAPAFGKKSNWNAVNVAFGVKEKQDDYSFGDEMNTDLTAKNKNQFLIYSTVINAIRKFITEYNTEIDEIIMQGAGERQEAMYQRFFQSAGKYFPGWHHDGKHSLVRDVPRQKGKKVREQGVAEGLEDTQKKIEDTINKLEDRLKHAKTDEQWDNIKNRIERLQAGLKRSKQGVAEGWTHDSLAAELFETPSYENRLQEMLAGAVAFMEGGTDDGVTMFSKSPGSHQHQNNASKPDQEHDLEGNTVKNSLHTIVRVATHLEKAVTDDEEFPEWVSEKIGSIKSMMVSVMDYVISSHEQANGDRLDHGPK
jgi:hypothetical protein